MKKKKFIMCQVFVNFVGGNFAPRRENWGTKGWGSVQCSPRQHQQVQGHQQTRDPAKHQRCGSQASEWCLKVAGVREHGTTHQQPLTLFRLTKQIIQPLPFPFY